MPLLALQQLGRLTPTDHLVVQLDRQFQHDIRHGDLLHAREMAWFYLDILPQPELAQWLIEQNWSIQKELEDRLLLARMQ